MNSSIIPTRVTVPAGTYVVGDPCYSVPEDRWIEWLEAADFTDHRRTVLAAELDGHPVVGVSTMYGDGVYTSLPDGVEYPVDAGLLGLVPMEVAVDVDEDKVVTFSSEVECFRDEHGTVHLGHIQIPTGDSDSDSDWDWYH